MTFKEIIRENTDRLFIVDTECFIIFTGSSINDDRPFIRIGTWYDLPVEIIPLIENVILSDRILGNPAHEQFNIDIRNLIANRYIGSESILKRFLDYQKNFGLDLTNVSIVNIEKDLPELPKHSSISDRDQFIGVFYSDGNIKIVNDEVDIFNLNTQFSENTSISGIQEHISQDCKGKDRYSGQGFVITDNNPLFYSGGYFTSYQYPATPLSSFSRMGIDPSRIREVLLPTQNILNLSSLMKFKHSREGKIRIFSDNPEQVELIKKLFKNSTVVDERFSSMNFSTGDGLRIVNYENSPNIKLLYRIKTPEPDELSVAFIKLHHDTKKILRENPDLVLITYTAYEESALLFKSSEVPVILIDDGNRNLKKIGDTMPVVRKGVQYEFRKISSESEIAALLGIPDDTAEAFSGKDAGAIETYMRAASEETGDPLSRFNAETMLRFHINNTGDRKFFSSLRRIQQDIFSGKAQNISDDEISRCRIILAIYKGSCYQVLERTGEPVSGCFTDTYSASTVHGAGITAIQAELGQRILHDRERLNRLLRHFYDDRRSSGRHEQLEVLVQDLRDEIGSRKEIYSADQYQNGEFITQSGHGAAGGKGGHTATQGLFPGEAPFEGSGAYSGGKGTGARNAGDVVSSSLVSRILYSLTGRGIGAGGAHGAAAGTGGSSLEASSFMHRAYSIPAAIASVFTGRDRDGSSLSTGTRIKRGFSLIVPLLVIIALAAGIILYRNTTNAPGAADTQAATGGDAGDTAGGSPAEIITVKRVNTEEKALLEKRNVVIRDVDIYNYANDVAVKNGYEKITYSGLKQKNPHWIYPSNVFIMLDGEKVVVQKGDTLWDLAHAKLEKMNADFYKIIEEIEKTDPADRKRIQELTAQAEQFAYIPKQREIINSYKLKAGNEN